MCVSSVPIVARVSTSKQLSVIGCSHSHECVFVPGCVLHHFKCSAFTEVFFFFRKLKER